MAVKGGKIYLFDPIAFANEIVNIGNLATVALATRSVVIGPGSSSAVGADESVVIGRLAQVDLTSLGSVAIGTNVSVSSPDSIVIGSHSSVIAGGPAIAIGWQAVIDSVNNVDILAIGNFLTVKSNNAIGIGANFTIGTGSQDTVVISNSATLPNNCFDSIIIGSFMTITGSNTIDIGIGHTNSGGTILMGAGVNSNGFSGNSIGIGNGCAINGSVSSVVVGDVAHVGPDLTPDVGCDFCVVIGSAAYVLAGSVNGTSENVVVGHAAISTASECVVVGSRAQAHQGSEDSPDGLVVVGARAQVNGNLSIAVGYSANVGVDHKGSQAYGAYAVTSEGREVVFGSHLAPIGAFHAVNDTLNIQGIVDLFRFDLAGITADLTTNFYLVYQAPGGIINYSQVFLNPDSVDPNKGNLYVPITFA